MATKYENLSLGGLRGSSSTKLPAAQAAKSWNRVCHLLFLLPSLLTRGLVPTLLSLSGWSHMKSWVHQNRASPFASDFRRRLRYRREFRSGNQICPLQSQRKSPFASDFLRRANRASWGLKNRAILRGSGKNRRRNRRESRDFGALRWRGDGVFPFRWNLN